MPNKKISKFTNKFGNKLRRWIIPSLVVLLLGIFASLSLIESSHESATADEVSHIPAGISYVQTDDFRINSEHPVLIKYLSGLSAQFVAHPKLDTNWPSFKNDQEYDFGRHLLYFTPGNDADKIVFWGRLPVLILAMSLGLVIFFWAQSMFGATVGLLALAFYSLDPSMIAFSHLVTFDLPMAAFVAAMAYCLWLAYQKHASWKYKLAGLFLGLALATKISAVSAVVMLLILLIPAALKFKQTQRERLRFYFNHLGLVYLSAFITVWLTYLVIQGSKVWQHANLLPGSFTESLYQGLRRYGAYKPMYLGGYYSNSGQVWFFPGSFIIKSTLVVLLVTVCGLIYVKKNKYYRLSNTMMFLVLPIVVTLVLVMETQFAVGLRLIFVIYPFLFILLGRAGYLLIKNYKHGYSWLALGAAYYVFTLASAYPNYLAYSNELFGGRKNSYRYLADSNLDWGQGLKQLKAYTDKHCISNLPIIYFGMAEPAYYGFKTIDIGIAPFDKHWLNRRIPRRGGWLAVSASIANYSGLNKVNYKIRGVYPIDTVAGSILIYQIPEH
ncbi:MAG TPA: glycosyltransferase family 39 protein [Candidatus Saccharimonadales bacterium]|nr:glycosyltransferase family 39 protein [Candidatus Saccharimonadales bacterium]